MVGVTLGEMKPMYAADISTAQKEEFDAEVKRKAILTATERSGHRHLAGHLVVGLAGILPAC